MENTVVIAPPPRHKLPTLHCARCTSDISKRKLVANGETAAPHANLCGKTGDSVRPNCRTQPESEIPRVLVTGEGKVCEALPQSYL